MRILITGGSGFIGTNLVEHYISGGHEVLNLDIVPPRNPAHAGYWQQIDLRDAGSLSRAVQDFNPEIILHMGARTDLDGKTIEDYAANTTGVENLVSAIEALPALQRIIFASSRLVNRIGYLPQSDTDYCPTTPYGESKVQGEEIVRANASRIPCPWMIVRPTSIWGPWFDVPYKTFFLTIYKGRYVHPGSRPIFKSFGFVANTVYELDKLVTADAETITGKTLYLADYPETNITDMANCIQREMSVKPIRTLEPYLLRPAAWAGDILKLLGWKNPPLTSFRLNNLLTHMVYDMSPLEAIVGDLPYTVEEGVTITVSWMQEQGEI